MKTSLNFHPAPTGAVASLMEHMDRWEQQPWRGDWAAMLLNIWYRDNNDPEDLAAALLYALALPVPRGASYTNLALDVAMYSASSAAISHTFTHHQVTEA